MSDRWLVVGLGNPGPEYERTRHNVGFLVVRELERRTNGTSLRRAHRAELSETTVAGHKVLFARPQTFMNLSGQSVSSIMRYYKLEVESLLVIYDDLDLGFGRVRVRPGGSAGGHNGVRSLISALGTQEFARVRVGIGRPSRGDPMRHVLGRWTSDEREALGAVIATAADAACCVLESGLVTAMNDYNSK